MGKRDSCRHSSTGFSENDLVTETNYPMFMFYHYLIGRRLKPSEVSFFLEYVKNTLSKISTSYSNSSSNLKVLIDVGIDFAFFCRMLSDNPLESIGTHAFTIPRNNLLM